MPTGFPSKLYQKEFADQICALYKSGLSVDQIEQKTGWHHSTVARVLRRNNIAKRPGGMIGRRHTQEVKDFIGERNSGPRTRLPGDERFSLGGHVVIYVPGHPFSNSLGEVGEHRLVMEKMLGRYLLPAEKVHHINCIKDDNAEENLHLFASSSEHSKLHAPVGRKHSAETRRNQSIAQTLRWKREREKK